MTTVPAPQKSQVPLIPAPKISERAAANTKGWPVAGAVLVAFLAAPVLIVVGVIAQSPAGWTAVGIGVTLVLAALIVGAGLTLVAPNESRVLQVLGGNYSGTLRTPGFRWVNPLTLRKRVSVRIRNHETGRAKVNDVDGNPIEISAVVVWQVEDTARAVFAVDDFVEFVEFQTEAAVRHIAGSYPYDASDRLSLRENADDINAKLAEEIAVRVNAAGVRVIESRITRLAYAPEIAQAMLRRQQAGAVIAARQRIVEGAVTIVQQALDRLESDGVIDLDDERKAAMVSNLLVVLCADRDAQPVVNTGTLYQ
ncbi:SPFH domain-containing protein [Hoyosella altamirensis]|uniref:Regulator of protease activity HflC (Stomatin/prohibitin superfamily) n=1 Tax=Hoyosella altamirensis TaxID=616997 RepID=A0A839RI24_9ACTN|nr:SPFH domain-containing protein [Hoyosella altamirensis]MBB3035773.1 regulator of protease activity HflC (stomatin/prohibitin superfamily) [Hoyosella altamirensis]